MILRETMQGPSLEGLKGFTDYKLRKHLRIVAMAAAGKLGTCTLGQNKVQKINQN